MGDDDVLISGHSPSWHRFKILKIEAWALVGVINGKFTV